MWGHHHSYQRTHPVYNTTVVSTGTTHVVIGMAGYWLSRNFVAELPEYMAVANDTTWYVSLWVMVGARSLARLLSFRTSARAMTLARSRVL